MRFERHAVEAAWLALAGAEAQAPIDFAPSVLVHGAAWRALDPVLALLARSTGSAQAKQGLVHLHARIEDMLLTTLLLHQVPALAAALAAADEGTRGTSFALRRAQAHMRQHLDEPLTLSSVARTAGVAVRTLQAAFHAHCGMGPMQWLREQRLHAVHAVLSGAGERGTRVTDTALRFGFTHLGEFSRAYRLRFGETPRETLARRG